MISSEMQGPKSNLHWANLISFICHPLLTLPLFVIIVMYSFEDLKKATFVSSIIIVGIFIPLTLWMLIKSKNGTYTNFDVSDKLQRKSLFYFAVPLIIVACIILYLTGQPKKIWLSVSFGLVITIISQIVNLFIKSSLHVSLNIFLAFLVIPVNLPIGIFLLVLTILIGWSRIALKKHSLQEVLIGAVIGLTVSPFLFFIK